VNVYFDQLFRLAEPILQAYRECVSGQLIVFLISVVSLF